MRPKRDLVRVVRTPAGEIIIDPTGRASGRGAYLCRDAACWDVAARRRAIEHALGQAMPDAVSAALAAGPDGIPAAGRAPNHPAGDVPATEHDTTGGNHGTK